MRIVGDVLVQILHHESPVVAGVPVDSTEGIEGVLASVIEVACVTERFTEVFCDFCSQHEFADRHREVATDHRHGLMNAVDDDGTINFPIVGRIKVEGLSRLEVEQLIGDKIKPYLAESENPIVTVRINSFHFTILGEVGSPGVKTSGREKCSLLDAIAMSGDINILGKRDNIMLIREAADGGKSVHRLNILDPSVMKSPYFYLQQNDVLYIEPNSIRKTNASIGTSTHLWFSLASVLVSSATLVVNVINKTK